MPAGTKNEIVSLLFKYIPIVNWLLILAVMLFSLYQSIAFVRLDNMPNDWDAASHLEAGLIYLEYLKSGDVYNFFFSYHFYPPFAYQLFALVYYFLPSFPHATICLNLILIVFTYLVFKKTFKEEHTFQLSFTLFLYYFLANFLMESDRYLYSIFTWVFMLDLIAITFVILMCCSLYMYLVSKEKKISQLLFFALLFSFSLSTRSQTIPLLIVPGLLFFKEVLTGKKFTHAILFITVQLVPLSWYLINLDQVREYSKIGIFDTNDIKSMTGLPGLLFYIKLGSHFVKDLWFFYFGGVLTALAMIFSSKLRELNFSFNLKYSVRMLFFLESVAGVLFLLLIPNKQIRYIFPVVIVFSLGLGGLIAKKNKYLSLLMTFIVLIFCLHKLAFKFPKPFQGTTAFSHVSQLIKSAPFAKPAYYFEQDSILFNLNNITLLHLQQGSDFVASNNPNLYAKYSDQRLCNFNHSVDYLVIYSKQSWNDDEVYVAFDDNCWSKLNSYNLRELYRQKFDTGEQIRVLEPQPL